VSEDDKTDTRSEMKKT